MNHENSTPIIVTTTAETESALAAIATALLEKRLAACCQIGGPMKSVYRWKGEIESAQEFVCTVKTMSKLSAEVFAVIRSLHPYDEPEIIVTPIVGGSETYLQWIADSVDAN